MEEPGRRRASPIRKLLLLLGTILLGVGSAELVLRELACREAGVDSFALVRERYLGRDLPIFAQTDDAESALVPNTVVGDRIRINAEGFRGNSVTEEKPSGTLRAVCLGGSSVFGTTNSGDGFTFPAQLERLARASAIDIEVLNGGVPGFAAASCVARFTKKFLGYRPDFALLYCTHNDLLNSRTRRIRYDPRAIAPVTALGRADEILSHSACWLRVRALATHREKANEVRRAVEQADPEAARPPPGSPARRAELARHYERLAELSASETGLANPYVVDSDLAAFRRAAEDFVAASRRAGVVPVLCSEALAVEAGADESAYRAHGDLLVRYFPDAARFDAAYRAYCGVLEGVASDRGAVFIDAHRSFPRREGTFKDHVHLTDAGATAMAEFLLAALTRSGVVSERTTGPPGRAGK